MRCLLSTLLNRAPRFALGSLLCACTLCSMTLKAYAGHNVHDFKGPSIKGDIIVSDVKDLELSDDPFYIINIENCGDVNLIVEDNEISFSKKTPPEDHTHFASGAISVLSPGKVTLSDGLVIKELFDTPGRTLSTAGIIHFLGNNLSIGKNSDFSTHIKNASYNASQAVGIFWETAPRFINGNDITDAPQTLNIGDGSTVSISADVSNYLAGINISNLMDNGKLQHDSSMIIGDDVTINTSISKSTGLISLASGLEINLSDDSAALTTEIGDNFTINSSVRDTLDKQLRTYVFGITQEMKNAQMTIGDNLSVNVKQEADSQNEKGRFYAHCIKNSGGEIIIGNNAQLSASWKNPGRDKNSGYIFGLKNSKEGKEGGKISFGDGARINFTGDNGCAVYQIYNKKECGIAFGNDTVMSITGDRNDFVYNVFNKGALSFKNNSSFTNKSTNSAQSYIFLNMQNAEITIGNDATIEHGSENTDYSFSIANFGGVFTAGNNLHLSHKSNNTKQNDTALKNYAGTVSIGKNSVIESNSANTAQSTAISNFAQSASLTLGDGANISADAQDGSGIGIMNVEGSVTFEGAADISASALGIYNSDGGKLSMTVTDKDKKITADQALQTESAGKTEITATTHGSLIEGGILSQNVDSVTNLKFSNKARINSAILARDYGMVETALKDSAILTGSFCSEDSGTAILSAENSFFTGFADHDGTSHTDIVLDNSRWDVTADSKVSNLSVRNDPFIDSTITDEKVRMTLGNFDGKKATFRMKLSSSDIDGTGNKTDFLDMKTSTGKATLKLLTDSTSLADLKHYDFGGVKSEKSILFADTPKDVSFETEEFNSLNNVYRYTVDIDRDVRKSDVNNNGTNWYITALNQEENEVPKAAGDAHGALFNGACALTELDTLHKRMGGVRNGESENGGWVRFSKGRVTSDSVFSDFKDDYSLFQMGADISKETAQGNSLTGIALSRKSDDISIRHGDLSGKNIGIAAYRTYNLGDGEYLDFIAKHLRFKNTYTVHAEDSTMNASYKARSNAFSAEWGRKFSLHGDRFHITPLAQLNYSRLDGYDYVTDTGVKISAPASDSLIGRLGFYAGGDFAGGTHYLKASVLHEFMGDTDITVAGDDGSICKEFGGQDTWFEAGIGGHFRPCSKDNVEIFYDMEKSFGGDYKKEWQGTLGIKFMFN